MAPTLFGSCKGSVCANSLCQLPWSLHLLQLALLLFGSPLSARGRLGSSRLCRRGFPCTGRQFLFQTMRMLHQEVWADCVGRSPTIISLSVLRVRPQARVLGKTTRGALAVSGRSTRTSLSSSAPCYYWVWLISGAWLSWNPSWSHLSDCMESLVRWSSVRRERAPETV